MPVYKCKISFSFMNIHMYMYILVLYEHVMYGSRFFVVLKKFFVSLSGSSAEILSSTMIHVCCNLTH